MAKKTTVIPSENPNMMMTITFGVMFVVNTVVLYLANMLFPEHVVLGTYSLTPLWSIVLSMGALSLLDTLVMPFSREIEKWRGRLLQPQDWLAGYLVINFIGVWAITRYSEQFGFGVSTWYVALIFAAAVNFVQGIAMMQFGKKK
jgi:uncharacterized membrane protein YvlD (DUF360 family)